MDYTSKKQAMLEFLEKKLKEDKEIKLEKLYYLVLRNYGMGQRSVDTCLNLLESVHKITRDGYSAIWNAAVIQDETLEEEPKE